MLLLTVVLLLAGAETGDWPRFRGPNGTGIQETGRLPAELGATRNVVWKTALPPGYSSPVVSGDRIFVTGLRGREAADHRPRPGQRQGAAGGGRARATAGRSSTGATVRRRRRRSRTGRTSTCSSPTTASLSYTFAGEERWRTPLGPVQQRLRHGRLARPGRRPGRPRLRPEPRLVRGRLPAVGRPRGLAHAAAGRAQRPLDADRLRPARRAAAGGGAGLVPHGLATPWRRARSSPG